MLADQLLLAQGPTSLQRFWLKARICERSRPSLVSPHEQRAELARKIHLVRVPYGDACLFNRIILLNGWLRRIARHYAALELKKEHVPRVIFHQIHIQEAELRCGGSLVNLE